MSDITQTLYDVVKRISAHLANDVAVMNDALDKVDTLSRMHADDVQDCALTLYDDAFNKYARATHELVEQLFYDALRMNRESILRHNVADCEDTRVNATALADRAFEDAEALTFVVTTSRRVAKLRSYTR